MLKMKYILLLLLVIGLFTACNDDDILGESEITTITPGPQNRIVASVSGIVVDQQDKPMQDLELNFRGTTYTTDVNGYFRIIDTPTSDQGGYLTFTQSGYYNNYKYFYPEAGKQSFVRVRMVAEKLSGDFRTVEGGIIQVDGGATVAFDPNSIVDGNNDPYTGSVNVYAYWYNPSSGVLQEEMPGDLRGINLEEQAVQLATYGMMAVNLKDASGNKLQIADGQKATLTFPIPSELINDVPKRLPLGLMMKAESTKQVIKRKAVTGTKKVRLNL